MAHLINLTLSYSGEDAENHQLDFYDTAQALIGFERSLALTTHLVLNGKIITQAPSLRGAKIFVIPPAAGSWEIVAGIFTAGTGTALYKLATAPRDTPLGHFVSSIYEYVIQRTLGFTVDFEKSLGGDGGALSCGQRKKFLPLRAEYGNDGKCKMAEDELLSGRNGLNPVGGGVRENCGKSTNNYRAEERVFTTHIFCRRHSASRAALVLPGQ